MRQEEQCKRNTLGSDILPPNSKTAATHRQMPQLPIWTKLTSQMSIMGWTVTENENIVNKKCQKRRINIHWEPRTVNPGASVKWPLVAQRETSQGVDRMEANYKKSLWPKVRSGLNLPLLVLTAALFKEAGGHGRLRHPAGRSTMWRWESSTFSPLVLDF